MPQKTSGGTQGGQEVNSFSEEKMQMLNRQRKTKKPCEACGLHLERCLCALIPRLDLRTRICLVIHRRELKRTTNSGGLAVRALVNSEMRVRGSQDREVLDLSDLLELPYRSLLFYPGEGAQELTPQLVAQSPLPIQLIVPDGNWRQASKVGIRHPELSALPRVKLSAINTATQHLRKEHRPEGMSTLEAIARALAIIEGDEKVQPLFELYQEKLKRTLAGRGISTSPLS